MKKRLLVVVAAGVLILGVAISGTLAHFTDTDQAINTFSTSEVAITLEEHVYDAGTQKLDLEKAAVKENTYTLVAGQTLPKDPFITVKAGSMDCWVFVHIKETPQDLEKGIILYEPHESWEKVPGHEGYYYQTIKGNESEDQVLQVLAGGTDQNKTGQISVSQSLTKDMVGRINGKQPSLVFQAAAVQDDLGSSDTVAVAWERLPEEFTEG